eukprot:maker-scaffold_7-snap-gene-11.51-mRNA-1 protein AED:0.37 eAED:0.37 QI:197/1/1/1/1/1/2/67/121
MKYFIALFMASLLQVALSQDCIDASPSGITFSDGSPAECEFISNFCETYDFVKQQCQSTCNTCGFVAASTEEESSDLGIVIGFSTFLAVMVLAVFVASYIQKPTEETEEDAEKNIEVKASV